MEIVTHVCDRCGKQFEQRQSFVAGLLRLKSGKVNRVQLSVMEIDNCFDCTRLCTTVDLCDSCTKELFKFLRGE